MTLTLGPGPLGPEIPADFVGLSFESSNLLRGRNGAYIFSAENKPLIELFRGIGIRNLRIGGGTADRPHGGIPDLADIDQLFAFARAADVRVIYTLRLLNGDKAQAAAFARHISDRHAAQLACFTIGNEPDWHAFHSYPGRPLDPEIFETAAGVPGSAYPSFLAKWRVLANAVRAAVPAAKFAGPDTGSNYPVAGAKDTDCDGKSWTERFAADERGRIIAALHHDYVGQSAEGVSVRSAVDAMLSTDWVAKQYPALFAHVLAPVQALGLPYRMTECNDFTGGVDGASNAFVSALWALDYMHWHAARGAIGVNFHNKRWIHTCTIIQDGGGEFRFNSKAYGLKAFTLGSRGRSEALAIENREHVNLTAYAVRGETGHVVTLINKEHGTRARAATVSIRRPNPKATAEAIFLTAPNGDPTARTGITLGDAVIERDGSWHGKWTPVTAGSAEACEVIVPPTSAAIVRIGGR